MSGVTNTHDEQETLHVEVVIPGHDPRKPTALFERTRHELMQMDGARCWVCQRTAAEAGPLQAHHFPVERSLANMIDWTLIKEDAAKGELGLTKRQRQGAMEFDWHLFFHGAIEKVVPAHQDGHSLIPEYSIYVPVDPYMFVDDMTVNGLILCRSHHIGRDMGIHMMPHPLWIAQRYGIAGYEYSAVEILHHDEK